MVVTLLRAVCEVCVPFVIWLLSVYDHFVLTDVTSDLRTGHSSASVDMTPYLIHLHNWEGVKL